MKRKLFLIRSGNFHVEAWLMFVSASEPWIYSVFMRATWTLLGIAGFRRVSLLKNGLFWIVIARSKVEWFIKQGLQTFCETAYSRSGINQMWILRNSNELLEHLKSPAFNYVTSIKSFDFSTINTTIPHQKLKSRLTSITSIIRNTFIFKHSHCGYKYLLLGHDETYFVKGHSDSKSKYSEDDIIKMLEFLVDNIFVVFAGKVFQQRVSIPMGTKCVDIFLYSYEAEFIPSVLSTEKKHLAVRFNLTYRYIDDVLSINNSDFENYLGQMYPAELEIKHYTEHHFRLLHRFTTVDREGKSTSHFRLRQKRWFQFPHHKLSVPE